MLPEQRRALWTLAAIAGVVLYVGGTRWWREHQERKAEAALARERNSARLLETWRDFATAPYRAAETIRFSRPSPVPDRAGPGARLHAGGATEPTPAKATMATVRRLLGQSTQAVEVLLRNARAVEALPMLVGEIVVVAALVEEAVQELKRLSRADRVKLTLDNAERALCDKLALIDADKRRHGWASTPALRRLFTAEDDLMRALGGKHAHEIGRDGNAAQIAQQLTDQVVAAGRRVGGRDWAQGAQADAMGTPRLAPPVPLPETARPSAPLRSAGASTGKPAKPTTANVRQLLAQATLAVDALLRKAISVADIEPMTEEAELAATLVEEAVLQVKQLSRADLDKLADDHAEQALCDKLVIVDKLKRMDGWASTPALRRLFTAEDDLMRAFGGTHAHEIERERE